MVKPVLNLDKLMEDLLPEEKEELLKQVEGLDVKDAKKAIRMFKLHLDLPELTEEDLEPVSEELFQKANELSLLLVEIADELDEFNFKTVHPNAKSLLMYQMKKTIGTLGRLIIYHDKK